MLKQGTCNWMQNKEFKMILNSKYKRILKQDKQINDKAGYIFRNALIQETK